jgi:hypothetical protein
MHGGIRKEKPVRATSTCGVEGVLTLLQINLSPFHPVGWVTLHNWRLSCSNCRGKEKSKFVLFLSIGGLRCQCDKCDRCHKKNCKFVVFALIGGLRCRCRLLVTVTVLSTPGVE